MTQSLQQVSSDTLEIDGERYRYYSILVDHSLIAHYSAAPDAMTRNMALEFSRNRERFEFIAWCRKALGNLRVIPPGNGIMHQVNLEHLTSVVTASGGDGDRLAYPDTLVGTDSHTPMVNGLGVLGWGVGGIEAEAVMLGRKLSLRARGRLRVHRASGATDQFDVLMRLDTAEEVTCYTHGGMLPMVYREFLQAHAAQA